MHRVILYFMQRDHGFPWHPSWTHLCALLISAKLTSGFTLMWLSHNDKSNQPAFNRAQAQHAWPCSIYLTVDEPLSYLGHIYHPYKQCLVTLFTLDTNSIFPSQPAMMINISHMADMSLWVAICLSFCLGLHSIYWLSQEDWLFKNWCHCHSTKWTAPLHYDNTVGQMYCFLPFAFFFFLLHSSEGNFQYISLLCHLHQNVLVGGKTIKKDKMTI